MNEPVMCPYCGSADLFEQEQSELELDEDYWVVYHWSCAECGESFDKVVSRPLSEAFEDVEDEGPLWS